MIEIGMMGVAVGLAGWLCWPPRGEAGRWLGAAWAVLWVALVAVGLGRGVLPGFLPWLLLLAALGALAELLVLWSVVVLLAQGRAR